MIKIMSRLGISILFLAIVLSLNTSCQNFFWSHTGGTTPVLDPFITEWTVPSGDFTLPLTISASYNMTVDWGDGSPTSTVTIWNDADATHTYASGTYQISITGVCEIFFINNGSVKLYIDKIIQWGNVGFTSFLTSFYGCSNLTEVPSSAITGLNGVLDCGSMFENCSSLTSIPSSFFDNFALVTGFSRVFLGTGLTSIPSGLFDNCAAASVMSVWDGYSFMGETWG